MSLVLPKPRSSFDNALTTRNRRSSGSKNESRLSPCAKTGAARPTSSNKQTHPSLLIDTSQVSRPTPRTTRPPACSAKHDKARVAGRVHALVRRRCWPRLPARRYPPDLLPGRRRFVEEQNRPSIRHISPDHP